MSGIETIHLAGLSQFPLPSLDGASDKDDRGRVLVVAGGGRVPGAAILTGVAALRVGAGKLQMAAAAAAATPLGLAVPEAAILSVAAEPDGEFAPTAAEALLEPAGRVHAVVVGPGMMSETSAGALAGALMGAEGSATFVVDAAAMTGLGLRRAKTARGARDLILPPHAGEMARLLGVDKAEVERDPLGAARDLAAGAQAVVIMKGRETFIVTPAGDAWRHPGGVLGLGTSGSGDVLAGMIGGLAARGASGLTAALWAVCLHAAAGRRLATRVGELGFLARELLDEIPKALTEAQLR